MGLFGAPSGGICDSTPDERYIPKMFEPTRGIFVAM